MSRTLIAIAALALAPAALAQGASAPAPANPPPAAAPPYQSAFTRYRAWNADEARADWRRANDEMGRLDGHAGHLRAASAPAPVVAPAQPKPPAAAPAKPQPPHHGPIHQHGMEKKR